MLGEPMVAIDWEEQARETVGVFIIVSCKLSAAVLSNVSRVDVLCEVLYTHCRVEEVGNVTGECDIDVITDCFMD